MSTDREIHVRELKQPIPRGSNGTRSMPELLDSLHHLGMGPDWLRNPFRTSFSITVFISPRAKQQVSRPVVVYWYQGQKLENKLKEIQKRETWLLLKDDSNNEYFRDYRSLGLPRDKKVQSDLYELQLKIEQNPTTEVWLELNIK